MKIEIGSGVFVALTIILVIFKVMGLINFPWLWVFCPLWIAPATILGVIAIILGFILLILLFVLGVLIIFSPLILIALLVHYIAEKW